MISEKRLKEVKQIASDFSCRESLVGEAAELLGFYDGMSPEPFDSVAGQLWTKHHISWGMALATVLVAYQQKGEDNG